MVRFERFIFGEVYCGGGRDLVARGAGSGIRGGGELGWDVPGDYGYSGGDGPRDEEGGPEEAGGGGGGDGGRPDGEGEDGEHGGFSPGGGAGQDAEEDAESAGDVSRAGEVGKEAMEGDPGGDESGGAVYIDEMREADGDDPEGEEDAGEADTAVAGSKGERGSGGDWGEAGEECPAAGEEHGEFAEAEPGAFDERSCEEVREFEQGPGDEVGEEDLRGQFGGGAEEQAEAAEEHEDAGGDGDGGAGGDPGWDGLPDEGEVAVDEGEDAEADHADGE